MSASRRDTRDWIRPKSDPWRVRSVSGAIIRVARRLKAGPPDCVYFFVTAASAVNNPSGVDGFLTITACGQSFDKASLSLFPV